jgi:hypothetical protein
MPQDYFRYRLSSTAPKDKDLVFFPYWRFKGILFACGPSQIRHQFIDISHQAVESPFLPPSVGLRSQALKLQFVSPQLEGRFLSPTQSSEQVIQGFHRRFGRSLPKPILHQTYIGETLSLLYSPIYIEDKLFDAVLNKPLCAVSPDVLDLAQFPGGKPSWGIRFISALCPHCGWDLEGERNTWVLLCKNCASAWYPAGKTLKRLRFGRQPDKGDQSIFLPFWRIKPEISGIDLKSYADLIAVANLPKVSREGWKQIEFRFWVPAFKVRPKVFLRLSTQMTLAQPQGELVNELPPAGHHPITLPLTEAVESLKINLASFLKPSKLLIDILGDVRIETKSVVLVYVPFKENQHELVQPDLQLALNKNLLALSKNL